MLPSPLGGESAQLVIFLEVGPTTFVVPTIKVVVVKALFLLCYTPAILVSTIFIVALPTI